MKQVDSQNLMAELTRKYMSGTEGEVVDPITFIEAPWGLGINLTTVQRFILKCFYNIPLDSEMKTIDVPDVINDKILYSFTEQEFLGWLYEEGRCNTKEVFGKDFRELDLVIGRRGTKCRYSEDFLPTTLGSITFAELLERKRRGEDIGVLTYDPKTYNRQVTHNFTVWDNGTQRCLEIITKKGLKETSSWNHPYLVWREDWDEPQFVELEEIRSGDRIAVSAKTDLFGEGGLGVGKASLLGYFQGDGGTTESVMLTTKSSEQLEDFKALIESEFSDCCVKKRGKASWRLGYNVVKKSGRFKQNGSQKNSVKEWLESLSCFGKKAIEKTIPDVIMKANKKEVAAFLSKLYACDGWATTEKRTQKGHGGVPKSSIGYCSASQKLVDGVRHLLLKFGIHTSTIACKVELNGKFFDSWKVIITDKNSLNVFAKEIGIFSKESAVNSVLCAANKRGKRKGIFQSAPKGVWNRVRRKMRERELSCASVVGKHGVGVNDRLRVQYSPSLDKVLNYGQNIGDGFLEAVGGGDILWDIVKSVEEVGSRKTVDLCVEKTHIIGGDIISHNSTLAALISNYELYKLVKKGDPSAFYGFPPDTDISITNVAPTDEQAGVVYDMILAQATRCPFLRDRTVNVTQTYFNLMTESDKERYAKKKQASLTCRAGGCSSNSLRGHNNLIVILDEMAFFIDNGGRFSGDEVYRALKPSTTTFRGDGKVICISSPYAKYGMFYERYNQSFDETDHTLMFQMYSSMVNPNIDSAVLRQEKRRNKTSFLCEYGGEFSDSITAWVEEESELRACVLPRPAPSTGITGISYYAGIDLGLKNDGTAIAIVHQDPKTKKIFLDYADVWYAKDSDVWETERSIYKSCRKYANRVLLKISEVAKEVKAISLKFPIKKGWFDQWNGYALQEQLHAMGMKQFTMKQVTDKLNSQIYQLSKSMYQDKLLDLFDHPILIRELLSLEAEKRSKNRLLVRAPNKLGSHDDISDAFVRAVWCAYENHKGKTENITSLVGGGHIIVGSKGTSQQSMLGFQRQRVKKHGAYPRMTNRPKHLSSGRR